MRFRSSSGRAEPRIELTPLIDVVFQLLLFFSITTTYVTERMLAVDLPVADAEARSEARFRILVLTIDTSGHVVHGTRPLDTAALERLLRREAARDASQVVLIRADERVPHGSVVAVMDAARRHGLTRLAIGSRAPTTPSAPPGDGPANVPDPASRAEDATAGPTAQ